MSRANKRNIFLIGMMGSGKTTIGKILAEHLGWKFDDSDHKIEQATGKSIVSIFSEKGEDHFRNLESDHLIETAQQKKSVTACGGGIILNKRNRMLMRKSGTVIFLDVPLEILTSRLQNVSNRPLLENLNGNESRLTAIWLEREKLYRQTAHITINASLSPQSCANNILKELKH